MNKEMIKMYVDMFVDIDYSYRSEVGTRNDTSFPIKWGNVFDLRIGENSVRVLNMNFENMREAAKRFLPTNKVKIHCYWKHCIIVDERIPDDWYSDKLNFTGTQNPCREFVENMFEYYGDPNGEALRLTDPIEYYEQRGIHYSPRFNARGTMLGVVTSNHREPTVDLVPEWQLNLYVPYRPVAMPLDITEEYETYPLDR